MANTSLQTDPVPSPGRATWRAWKIGLCLAAIFVGGAAVGAVAALQVLRFEISRRADSRQWTSLLLNQVDEQIHLTVDQRRALEPVVRSGVDGTLQVRDQAFLEIGGIVQRSRAQAAATLSTDQQRRLDQFIEKRTKLLRRWTGNVVPATLPNASPVPTPH